MVVLKMIKMKRNYIIKAVLGLTLISTTISCTKELDIAPRQNISSETALSTPDDVQNALVGAYSVVGGAALYGTNLVLLPDLYAGNSYLDWTGTFNSYRDVAGKSLIATNPEATRTWIAAYRAINIANTVLGSLDIITDADMKDRVEGEALFIRGIMYFELVRLYALPYEGGAANSQPGVPLVLTAIKSTADVKMDLARNTVAEVYTQIEGDLTAASTKLPATNSPRAGANSALAFLSRVYLQEQKYAEARDAANSVISSGEFALLSNLEAPFRIKNSDEGIFEIQQDEQTNAGTSNDGLATFFASLPGIGRADARVNSAFANSFDPADKRRTELIYSGTGAKTGFYTAKWSDFYGNIPVARITEMYLTRAEANLRLGTVVGDTPANDLNRLRLRAGLLPNLVPTISDILTEREKELAFEGFRLHDYKRTKRSLGALPYNDPKLVFPIPDREIGANPSLEQNAGY
jgi:starch-binding outer membrane protein, SusD/RagB family